jgi:general secretion pathway protein D
MSIEEGKMTDADQSQSIIKRYLHHLTMGMIVLCLILLTGCLSRIKARKTVTMEEPQASSGIVVEVKDPEGLEKLGQAIDALELAQSSAQPVAGDTNWTFKPEDSSPQRIGVHEALGMANGQTLPPNTTNVISLPKLSPTEINEISARLELDLGKQFGYMPASAALADALPLSPQGIIGERTLARSAAGATHVLRFGFQSFVSQPPQFWILGVIVDSSGRFSVNSDLAGIEPAVAKMLTGLDEMRKGLTVRDMEKRLIQLSYVDAETALSMLSNMGITTINTIPPIIDKNKGTKGKPESVPAQVEFAKLPYVVTVPDPEKGDTGLVGSAKATGGQMGLSLTPGSAGELTNNPVAGPLTQLMVIFHPAHPEQFSNVRHMLDSFIDRPARQIFIEGMVLEISETGLKDLGIDWALLSNNSPLSKLNLGTRNVEGSAETLDATIDNITNIRDIFKADLLLDWKTTVRALIRTGKAEILSRPSVLTLNNRQATIRVGRDLPILSSTEGMSSSSNKLVFKFSYLSTGILLNIRPRINEAGTEVSMLIDTIVSAQVPGADLEVVDQSDGTVLASAPTISTRRVQTYGRIRNNTPFIIGGLVARDKTSTQDKVPILGDLPWIGIAFRATKTENTKREVIIVLTPYILPEEKLIPRSLPKDEELFDSFGHELFRDSYRIRAEDVFDLTFLLENARIVAYRNCAREVVGKNFRIGEIEPFRTFVRDNVPGEPILVTRMIYEVIKRLNLQNPVLASRLIYLRNQQGGGGYDVQFLEAFLAEQAKTKGEFKELEGKAMAITFTDDPEALNGGLDNQSIPEVSLVECPDREAWGKILWELNQPSADGKKRYTVLIQDESDVLRLRRAQALKKIITLNGGTSQMRLRNFSVGKVLLMPELRTDQTHLIDADSARFFFHTEHYYAATLQEVEDQLNLLDALLRRPDISVLLESGIPGGFKK